MNRPMDCVAKNLCISNINYVVQHDTSQFDVIVGVCQDDVSDNVACEYHHFNMSDGDQSGLIPGDASYELFRQAASTVVEALDNNRAVLVHCHAGQSRSVSVAMAALAAHRDMRFGKARRVVEENRPQSQPNVRLLEHAEQFADQITS